MKYIKIKNKGIIESQALHLVGASTKLNDSTKIGQFGSGNKYALAYLLRNGYEVRVFAGIKEIKIETKKEVFRGQEFNVIHIDGEKTSITIEMGKDWQFWQAIREVYCNALDEGDCTMDFVQTINQVEDETHFYINTKKDVMEFMSNFDNYFATNKKVIFECEQGRILEKTGDVANIYRKGIKCFNSNKTSVFDYDFFDISIDENRIVKYSWNIEEKMWDLIFRCDNEEAIMKILHNCHDNNYIEGCIADFSTISASGLSDTYKKCLNKIKLAPKGFAGLLKPDEIHQHIILPTKIFQILRGSIGDENVGDNFKISKDGGIFRYIKPTKLQDATIKQAMYFFSETEFDIPFEIKIAIFDEKKIMGCVCEKYIVISDVCLEKGINDVVNTILEEYVHLKYGVQDETRAFQTAMITEFISYMKKVNSFVI